MGFLANIRLFSLTLTVGILSFSSTIWAEEASFASRVQKLEERVSALEKVLMIVEPLIESKNTIDPAALIKIPKQRLEILTASAPMLSTEVRAFPHYNKDVVVGLRLVAIKQGSYFDQIGIKNYDSVLAVSGEPTTDLPTLINLLTTKVLQNDGEHPISILRGGRSILLRIKRE